MSELRKTICDRCGVEIGAADAFDVFTLRGQYRRYGQGIRLEAEFISNGFRRRAYDLCPSCCRQLEAFLKPAPGDKEDTP